MNERTDELSALCEAIRQDPEGPFSLDGLQADPELERCRELEAERLKRRLSHIPWYAKAAAEDAKAGVNFWEWMAAGYRPASYSLPHGDSSRNYIRSRFALVVVRHQSADGGAVGSHGNAAAKALPTRPPAERCSFSGCASKWRTTTLASCMIVMPSGRHHRSGWSSQ